MTVINCQRLREEDPSWDYRGEFTKRLTHGFHSYPAMMIPQVAARLIQTYSHTGDTVLDPFCGSGSVLVEAKALGRHSWGLDLNPVALLVARAKTTPLAPGQLRDAYQAIEACLCDTSLDRVSVPDFFNLAYWFKPAVAHQLAIIKLAIEVGCGGDPAVRDFFLVAFSEAVRLSSNSRRHEFKLFRYDQQVLDRHDPNAIAIFLDKAQRNIARMAEYYVLCPSPVGPRCTALCADTTKPISAIPERSVDLVVTSPPYGDSRTTVAYGQFSRLSAQWLGFDDAQSRALDAHLMGGSVARTLEHRLTSPSLDAALAEISAHDPLRARQVLSFYLDLTKALENVSRLVRSGGVVCIVIGNRRVKQVQLPTDLIVAEIAAGLDLLTERIVVRNIPSKTMPLKNSPTNVTGERELTMHQEYIVVLCKA